MKSHPFIDRAGQCWLWNFRTRPVLKARSLGFTSRHPVQTANLWQLVIVISSQWDISQRGDQISHRCVEFDRNNQPRIIRLKESATFPWDTKPELFRRVDRSCNPAP